MTKLEELMIIVATKNRLDFLKFRQSYIYEYGSYEFKRLLKQAEKELS